MRQQTGHRLMSGVVIVALGGLGCADGRLETVTLPTWPHTEISAFQPAPSASTAGVQCSDGVPVWITQSQSPEHAGDHTVEWRVEGTATVEVEVRYRRSTDAPIRLLPQAGARTNLTSYVVRNREHGGQYLLRLRIVANPCRQVIGAWSSVLVLTLPGSGDAAAAPPARLPAPMPAPCPYHPCDGVPPWSDGVPRGTLLLDSRNGWE